ncbi:MAG: DNA gyrase inhibitor YacG [Terriglobales bacterium]
MPQALPCPICRTPVVADDPEFPFCSRRCRVIDLGNWASGVYRVPVPPDAADPAAPDEET